MIIKSVELRNIRSYTHGRIEFPRGKVVLLGDIGAGKSTILMAIEFGLFGLGDQDGSSLLRVNENTGHVILEFEVDGKIYRISRSLKRKDGKVKQDKVIIEGNGDVLSMAPSDAKTYVLRILNYNEPSNPKARSIIFRYAIYTPQEEMKKILNANQEERKKTIRKAFRIEDYSNARDNALLLIKYLDERENYYRGEGEGISELKDKIDEIDKILREKEMEIEKRKIELDNIMKEIEKIVAKMEETNSTIMELKKFEGVLNSKRNELESYRSDLESLMNEINEKKKIYEEMLEKHVKHRPIKKFDYTKEEIDSEISRIDEEIRRKNEMIGEMKRIQGQHSEIIKRIKELEDELRKNSTSKLEEQIQNIRKEIEGLKVKRPEMSREEIDEIERNLEREIEELNDRRSQVKAKENDYRTIIESGICPTCDREVDPLDFEIKLSIKSKERNELEEILKEKKKKREEIRRERENIVRYERYLEKMKDLENLENSLKEKNERNNEIGEKLIELKKREEELKDNEIKLNEIKNETEMLEGKKRKLKEIRKKVEEFEKMENEYRSEEIRLESMKNEIENLEKMKKPLEEKISITSREIADLELKNLELKKKKVELDELKNRRDQMESSKAKINEELASLRSLRDERLNLREMIQRDLEKKERAIMLSERYREYSNWMREVFIPAVESIEKSILEMRRSEFSESFQRWFYMLVDDPTKSARIDEDFTPIVEQDGYVQEMDYLSGGERSAVALSYRLSLNSVVREAAIQGGENILILDEPTEGFSSEQIQKFPEILNQTRSDQVIIVSHEQDISRIADHTINIRKENGVSFILH